MQQVNSSGRSLSRGKGLPQRRNLVGNFPRETAIEISRGEVPVQLVDFGIRSLCARVVQLQYALDVFQLRTEHLQLGTEILGMRTGRRTLFGIGSAEYNFVCAQVPGFDRGTSGSD